MNKEVLTIVQISIQSTQTVTHALQTQLQAMALQTRHQHLLHLFAVADADVREYEKNDEPSFIKRIHHELVNARSNIQQELDDVVVKLNEMVANCGTQLIDDLEQLQQLQEELLQA